MFITNNNIKQYYVHIFDEQTVELINHFHVSYRYDANGKTPGQLETENLPPVPNRLSWEFNEPLLKSIDTAFDDAQKVLGVSI